MTVTASPALRQAMAAALEGVTAAALPADPPAADKFMLVLVSAAPDGYQVAAREFDVATGLWSATVVRPVRQLAKLPDESLSAILRAFAPLARLSDVKDGRVMLRLRAGWLRPRNAEAVRPGDAFDWWPTASAGGRPRCSPHPLDVLHGRGGGGGGVAGPAGDGPARAAAAAVSGKRAGGVGPGRRAAGEAERPQPEIHRPTAASLGRLRGLRRGAGRGEARAAGRPTPAARSASAPARTGSCRSSW